NPAANHEFQRQLFRILQARAVSGLQERVFNGTFGDVIIYVQDVSTSQIALRGVLVSDERDPMLSRIITAPEGRLITDEVNPSVTGAIRSRSPRPPSASWPFRSRSAHPAAAGASPSSAAWRSW